MKKKIIRVENVGVNETTYMKMLELKQKLGIPMKSLISLILNMAVQEIEIEFVGGKKIEIAREEE